MKFSKIISKSIIATALLGTTLGGVLSGINASADMSDSEKAAYEQQQKDNEAKKAAEQANSSSNNPQYADSNQSTSKSSNGSTKVTNGSLSLDSIPQLQFHDNDRSNNNKLQLQQNGQLRVTDYRNKDKNSTNGWNLKVTADGFNQNNSFDNNDWQMNLNKTNIDDLGKDSNNQQVSSNTPINPLSLKTNDGQNSFGNLVTNGQYGITQLTYGTNNDDATLNIPNVKPDSNNPYTTSMNWELSTTVKGNDN